jgi:site-specific DNA-methyltransferase (adenine-specific)
MTEQASFTLRNRNPDVLTCIANLSNDEVFTPPELANQMLDMLAEAWAKDHKGENIWENKDIKFLDPCTKSGVFLREITARLTQGLEKKIPNLDKRVDHILSNQIYGIGITKLTSLLARRSVYCSKTADGEHSIAKSLKSKDGNIWYKRLEHNWNDTKCDFCGAPKIVLDRGNDVENYAYAFIHSDNIKKRIRDFFGEDMQFDVIIGNPPYQMKGGAGGTSDSSIYPLFVQQAKQLEPKYLSMVIPSRWLAGGRGMDDFRHEMLNSNQLLRLVDYPVSKEVFPNVEVKGGVCFFLWGSEYKGKCNVTVIRGEDSLTSIRELNEFDVFVRNPIAVGILRKVLSLGEPSVTEILTADTPFGIATNYDGFHDSKKANDVALYYVKSGKRNIGYMPRKEIVKNPHLIDKWKVLVPKAGSDGGQKIPDSVLGKCWIASPNSVATQTFIAFWIDSKEEATSIQTYYRTKFFRFIVSLRKITQDALKQTYTWVPMQKWDREWTDAELFKKYKLSADEIKHIESVIRPMDSTNGADDD